jgi:cytochrome c oxidase cbb3-type subunit 2
MKNGLLLFLGILGLSALSWAAVLLTPHRQYGALAQHKDAIDESLHPYATSGLVNQGRLVYQDLGCVYCHTQQVRRVGGDLERKWGVRESYARDYIQDSVVFLGSSRLGPDLRNVGSRLGDTAPASEYADWFNTILYAPAAVGAHKPAHAFLYETRQVYHGQSSPKALRLPAAYAPKAGYEVVPSRRAEALVAYLMSLKDNYDYPEEKRLNAPPAGKKEGSH